MNLDKLIKQLGMYVMYTDQVISYSGFLQSKPQTEHWFCESDTLRKKTNLKCIKNWPAGEAGHTGGVLVMLIKKYVALRVNIFVTFN